MSASTTVPTIVLHLAREADYNIGIVIAWMVESSYC